MPHDTQLGKLPPVKLPQPRIRALVGEILRSDADLDAFCSDYFPDVYRRFSDGMQRARKVTLLLDHADPEPLVDLLTQQTSRTGAPAGVDPPRLDGARIRVLFMAANPRSTSPLETGRESRQIEERVRAAKHRDAIDFISRWAVRLDDLQQALLEVQPQVLHFSGHASSSNQVLLEADQGAAVPVDQGAIVELIGIFKDGLRLAVLNTCFSETVANALVQHIDCAIGHESRIGDVAAIEFAASFYRGIGFGRSVEESFRLGCNALRLRGIPDEQIPRLKVKPGVDAGKLFLIGST